MRSGADGAKSTCAGLRGGDEEPKVVASEAKGAGPMLAVVNTGTALPSRVELREGTGGPVVP